MVAEASVVVEPVLRTPGDETIGMEMVSSVELDEEVAAVLRNVDILGIGGISGIEGTAIRVGEEP